MKKRLICILLSVLLVFSLLPAGAVATEETEETITYTDWESTDSLPTSGTYKLTDNVTVSSGITVASGDTLTLDLNGKTVTSTSTSTTASLFTIKGEFTLLDSSATAGKITTTSAAYGVNISDDGEFTMQSGTIDGYKYGVKLAKNSTFTMNGGTISNCSTYSIAVGGSTSLLKEGATITINDGTISNCGGIVVFGAASGTRTTFTMNGGTITGCTAGTGYTISSVSYRGTVLLYNADFTMNGGSITDNSTKPGADSTGTAGAVCVAPNSTFTMKSGTISGTTPGDSYKMYGGGVYISSTGSFTMDGGTISNNTAYYGGGVYNLGTFTMNDGTISENTATSNYGGGVYGKIVMAGGEITNHSASFGAGIYATGDSSMSGGTISGNSGSHGCGVYVNSGTFTMTNGVITGNNATHYGGGVYVNGSSFAFSGGAIYSNTAYNELSGNTCGGADIYSSSSSSITLISASSMNATDVVFTNYAWFTDVYGNRYSSDDYSGTTVDATSGLTGSYALIAAVDSSSGDSGSGEENPEVSTFETLLENYDSTDTFTISSVADWLSFVEAVNSGNYSFEGKTVELTTSLDFSEYEDQVAPVGTTDSPFKGTFDGGNYTISNITYKSDYTATYAGVFGVTSGATIQNLTVADCSFITSCANGTSYAGAIVACAGSGTTITNCKSTDNNVEAWFAGGITGHTVSTTITDVTVSGTTFAANTKSGCVIGYDGGGTTVNGATVNSTLTQSGSLPGAVIGQANGTSTLSNLTVNAENLYVIGSMETNNEYTVTISGDENSVTAAAIAGNVLTNTTLAITGGTYTVSDIVSGEDDETTTVSGTVSISGGTYSTSLIESYIATGYDAITNDDGTYTVGTESSWVVATNVRNGYDIAMGFYVSKSQLTTSHTVTITFNDATYDSTTSSWTTESKVHTIDSANWLTSTLTYSDGTTVECYVIVFEGIWAMQMDEEITLNIYDGSTAVCDSFTITINEYEDAYIASGTYKDDTNAVNLANAVKSYGAAAKTFYSYPTSSESES